MPRIKRWFPVNHNINRDPEVWAMRRTIGEKSLSVWLEFLSIADQNEGDIPGDYDQLIRSVSGTCQATVRTVTAVYQWAISKVWLASDPTLHVVKFLKYHKAREPIKPLLGSLPSEPSEPSEPKEDKKPPSAALFVLPDWIPAKSWKDFEEHRRKMRTPLSTRAKELAVKQLELLRKEGHEPAAVLDNCIARGWRGIFAPKENGSKPPAPKPRAKIERPPELTEEQIEKNKAFLKDLLGKIGAKG